MISLATPFNKSLRHRSIENQINYLSDILDEGYDNQLQSRYPEGKVFSNALLALSVIEFCDKNNIFKAEYSEAVDKCIDSDYDSGPVIFGYGAAATIMNIKTQASLGDKNSKITWAFFNLISLPVNIFQFKYYLFQQEPMFDLFMLWSAVEM